MTKKTITVVLFLIQLAAAADDTALAECPKQQEGLKPPSQRWAPRPRYTKEARKKRIEGLVGMSAYVEEDGTVRDVQVTRSLGYGLDEMAVAAVKGYVFWPAKTADGKACRFHVNVDTTFRLID